MKWRQLPRSRQDGVVTLDEHEQQQSKTALAAIPAEVRAFALEVATVPDEERPGAIGELYKDEKLRTFAELMIDLEQEACCPGAGRGRAATPI